VHLVRSWVLLDAELDFVRKLPCWHVLCDDHIGKLRELSRGFILADKWFGRLLDLQCRHVLELGCCAVFVLQRWYVFGLFFVDLHKLCSRDFCISYWVIFLRALFTRILFVNWISKLLSVFCRFFFRYFDVCCVHIM
jgi:hypothetical protein